MAVSFKSLGNYGHLGNSLFQAACTIALAKRNNDSYQFPSSWKYRNDLSLPSSCFVPNIISRTKYEEPKFAYQNIPYKPNLDLLGYFQSEKYFSDFKQDIHSLFTPKNLDKISEQKNKVSIHVRRTDYLKFPNHHPTMTMQYYEKAMSLFDAGTTFVVCSDDINWCKKRFIGSRFEFSDNKDPILDLILQIKCGHNIIANSSFSWWGAWMNKNNKVIAPKKWFGPALAQHDTKDLYPNGWILV